MYILTCNMVGWKKKCGFLCTTKYEKLRVWHHSDWLNHINHFWFFLHLCLSLSLSFCVPQLFFFFFFVCFKRCAARRRWRVWGRSWSGSCPGSWAEGSLTPSPGPTCTLWAPTRRGPAPAWHWYYWFAGENETKYDWAHSYSRGRTPDTTQVFSQKGIIWGNMLIQGCCFLPRIRY